MGIVATLGSIKELSLVTKLGVMAVMGLAFANIPAASQANPETGDWWTFLLFLALLVAACVGVYLSEAKGDNTRLVAVMYIAAIVLGYALGFGFCLVF